MKYPELLPSPHDGSKVKFCDECDSGCHRIIGNGIEIDLLPTIRQGDSLENRRAICAERWNTRVYPPEVKTAIDLYTPKKPLNQFKRYGKQRGYCPSCDRILDDQFSDIACRCGQRLDWSE